MRPYFKRHENAKAEPRKISLTNLGGAFWLILGGYSIAVTLFIVEKLFFIVKC